MSTKFLAEELWPQLKREAKRSPRRAAVAVAYFAEGASRQLPLAQGSRLVVDASEGAVKSGQTCPADLLALIKRGVHVFSLPNLHAKVFVFGRVAFVGSANVSRSSEGIRVEAAVRTTDPGVVKAVREFVASHCLYPQTPEQLERLARLYRRPKFPGGKRRKNRESKRSLREPIGPKVFLAQLVPDDWKEHDQRLHDAGEVVAKERRKHPRSFELDSFRWVGKCPFKRGDVAIQVSDEGTGDKLMHAPGNVLYVRKRRDKARCVSFVYVERPGVRRRRLKSVARHLGRGALKRLHKGGLMRDAGFREKLLKLWSA